MKAARAALRLDKNLLPPVGTKMLFSSETYIGAGVILGYPLSVDEDYFVSAVVESLKERRSVPLWSIREATVLELPDPCPPMVAWPTTELLRYDEDHTGLFVGPDGVAHLLHIGWDGPDRYNTWWKGCVPEIVGSAGGNRMGEKWCHGPEGWTDARAFGKEINLCPKCKPKVLAGNDVV